MNRVVVLVPIYTESLNEYEVLSLNNLSKHLSEFDIRYITFKGINEEYYLNFLPDAKFEFFEKEYFKSPQTYNILLKSLFFFQRFESEFDYFLMHHTDTIVFKNELMEWVSKAYDYIGAPLYVYDGTIAPKELLCIGNGGLSMHKISSAIRVLQTNRKLVSNQEALKWWKQYNVNGRIKYLPFLIGVLLNLKGNSKNNFNDLHFNEDVFWGKYVNNAFDWYKVAPFQEAYRFSMEFNCEELYALNNYQLPFGTHQWFKGGFLDFWKDKV